VINQEEVHHPDRNPDFSKMSPDEFRNFRQTTRKIALAEFLETRKIRGEDKNTFELMTFAENRIIVEMLAEKGKLVRYAKKIDLRSRIFYDDVKIIQQMLIDIGIPHSVFKEK